MSSFEVLLKQNNLSLTSLRFAVLDALGKYPHADVDQIYRVVKRKILTTSKQAIYNTLASLVDSNIVREIKPKGRPSLYETRVGDNHHHLVCRSCKAVLDANCLASAPCLEAVETHGFQIDEAEIVFWGICPKCQKRNRKKQRRNHE